jgi:hypothetical protein
VEGGGGKGGRELWVGEKWVGTHRREKHGNNMIRKLYVDAVFGQLHIKRKRSIL